MSYYMHTGMCVYYFMYYSLCTCIYSCMYISLVNQPYFSLYAHGSRDYMYMM